MSDFSVALSIHTAQVPSVIVEDGERFPSSCSETTWGVKVSEPCGGAGLTEPVDAGVNTTGAFVLTGLITPDEAGGVGAIDIRGDVLVNGAPLLVGPMGEVA